MVDGHLQADFPSGIDEVIHNLLHVTLEGHQSSPHSFACPVPASKGTDACS